MSHIKPGDSEIYLDEYRGYCWVMSHGYKIIKSKMLNKTFVLSLDYNPNYKTFLAIIENVEAEKDLYFGISSSFSMLKTLNME